MEQLEFSSKKTGELLMRKCRKARVGKGVFFLFRTILMILVVAVIAGRPALAYCDEAEQGKKFIVSYSAEKSDETNNTDQGKTKIPTSIPVPTKGSEVYSLENEDAVREVAEKRVEDLYPKEEGWINQQFKIDPY